VADSALVVNVPEAERYVSGLRERFDPSTLLGAPAHITLLYPFVEPSDIAVPILNRLEEVLAKVAPFAFTLTTPARFADTLYLAPEPAEPFIALTRAIVARFPRYLPYGGRFASVVPHLTVVRGASHDLASVEQTLSTSLSGLPGRASAALCREVVLIENSSGRWRRMHVFSLSSTPGADD
jgi:2'-5' RNA ligase